MKIHVAPSRRMSVLLVVGAFLLMVYAIWLTHWINLHRMFWADELLGWFFYIDPSWARVMANWNLGGEGSGYLYNRIARLIVQSTGANHLNSVRYYSSACIFGGFVLWTAMLRRITGSAAVIFPCAFLWFTDTKYLVHIGESRFYGQYILGCALAVWAATLSEKASLPPWIQFLVSLLAGNMFTGAHALGIGWLGLVLLGQMLTRRFTPAKLASMAGFALSFWQVWEYRALVTTSKSLKTWWVPKPRMQDIVHVYLRNPAGGYGLQAVFFGMIVVAAYLRYQRAKSGQPLTFSEQTLLAVLCMVFSGPVFLFFVSRSFQSVYLDRYLLPGFVAFSGLLAWGVAELAIEFKRRLTTPAVCFSTAVLCAAVIFLHARAMCSTANAFYEPFSNLDGLEQLGKANLPVAFVEVNLQEQLHLYRPAIASRFFMPLPSEQVQTRHYEQYDGVYRPYWVDENSFVAGHPHFIYLQTSWSRQGLRVERLLSDPDWTATRLPDVPAKGVYGGASSVPAWELVRKQPTVLATRSH